MSTPCSLLYILWVEKRVTWMSREPTNNWPDLATRSIQIMTQSMTVCHGRWKFSHLPLVWFTIFFYRLVSRYMIINVADLSFNFLICSLWAYDRAEAHYASFFGPYFRDWTHINQHQRQAQLGSLRPMESFIFPKTTVVKLHGNERDSSCIHHSVPWDRNNTVAEEYNNAPKFLDLIYQKPRNEFGND